MSFKDREKNKMNKILKKSKETKLYKNLLEKFPDADLVEVISKTDKEDL